jgi:hypothetical protein
LSFGKIKQAKQVTPKLKIEMYGKKGSWKTTSALESEGPILLIDREKGSELYGIAYDFDPLEVDPRDVKGVMTFGEALYTLNQQLNQINTQRAQLGEEGWHQQLQALVAFYAQSPYNLPEHTHETFLRGEFYWKTIIVDSGTWIYADLVEYYRQLFSKGSITYRLEPSDYQPIKKEWYKFLDNLISLPCHVIVTAHRVENRKPKMENGKMNYMAIDPDKEWKPDLEKKNDHVFDNMIYMDYDDMTGEHWAIIEKSRIIDKDKNPILPPRIDNVDSRTFIPYLLGLVKSGKGIAQTKPKQANVARTDAKFESLLQQVSQNIQLLHWSGEHATQALQQHTEHSSIDTLRQDSDAYAKLQKLYDVTCVALEQPSDVGGVGESDYVEVE